MMNNIQNKESIAIEQINQYYKPLIRACELINNKDFTSLYILGKAGIGKTVIVDQTLNRIKADYLVFKGDISEPKCYEFLQNNSDKVIVLRDVSRLLRRLGFIEMLKAATDSGKKRVVSRLTYAKHEGLKDSFEFTGKLVIEMNEIGKRYKEDLDALFSRGIFIELNLSYYDLKNIMYLICKNKFERKVTNYLFSFKNLSRSSFNLRTQSICLSIAKAAILERIDWREQVSLFLKTQISEIKKSFYRFAGNSQVKRIEFVKYLMAEKEISYVTAQKKVSDALILEDLYSNKLAKQAILSLAPIQNGRENIPNFL